MNVEISDHDKRGLEFLTLYLAKLLTERPADPGERNAISEWIRLLGRLIGTELLESVMKDGAAGLPTNSGKTNFMPPSPCPGCGHVMDAAEPISDDGVATGAATVPTIHDMSICIACGEILGFTEDAKLRRLRDGELEAAPSIIQSTLLSLQKRIRERGPAPLGRPSRTQMREYRKQQRDRDRDRGPRRR